jgi:putative phosphoesterase
MGFAALIPRAAPGRMPLHARPPARTGDLLLPLQITPLFFWLMSASRAPRQTPAAPALNHIRKLRGTELSLARGKGNVAVWAMRIAVLSDTHNRLPAEVCERIREADEIWHLGDVCDGRVLGQLERMTLVRVVRGNCDEQPDWPVVLDFELEGWRCHLEHIPTTKPPACDLFFHGHTHVPRDETIGGVRFLNPGCISRPKGTAPSFAWLTFEEGRAPIWKVMGI